MQPSLPRTRFQACLEHRQADRPPLTLGSPSCSLHKDAHARLLQHLELKPVREAPIIDSILQIVEPDSQLYRLLDIDLLWLLPDEPPVRWEAGGSGYVDELGRRFAEGGGFFNQAAHPLVEGSQEELRRFRFPELNAERVKNIPHKASAWFEQGYALALDGPWGIYEISSSLRGTEDYLVDLALNPHYAAQLAQRVLEEYHLPYYSLLLEAAGPEVQMVMVSDDLGSQNGLIFSPRTFRQVFKPLLRRLVEHIHSLRPVKVYLHSDGAIYDLLPDLVEIGIEGLNPVQYTARGMELKRLKSEFGRDLGFFGGTLENAMLSFSSPEQVRQRVRENIEILAPGGGFLFAPIHNISAEVPAENILALYQSGKEFGSYE